MNRPIRAFQTKDFTGIMLRNSCIFKAAGVFVILPQNAVRFGVV